jgi:hypothetical protein
MPRNNSDPLASCSVSSERGQNFLQSRHFRQLQVLIVKVSRYEVADTVFSFPWLDIKKNLNKWLYAPS